MASDGIPEQPRRMLGAVQSLLPTLLCRDPSLLVGPVSLTQQASLPDGGGCPRQRAVCPGGEPAPTPSQGTHASPMRRQPSRGSQGSCSTEEGRKGLGQLPRQSPESCLSLVSCSQKDTRSEPGTRGRGGTPALPALPAPTECEVHTARDPCLAVTSAGPHSCQGGSCWGGSPPHSRGNNPSQGRPHSRSCAGRQGSPVVTGSSLEPIAPFRVHPGQVT